jgi:hypothetical protein
VAWRKPRPVARIEPPEWYRNYHPEAWDQPDGHEQSMINGSGTRWPDCADGSPGWLAFHDVHARRRWQQAKHTYRQAHPAFWSQEFDDLLASRAVRR